jgi:hypothetical protein
MAKTPTHDEIAQQAYLLWESEGCPHGSDVQYWLRAEALLNGDSKNGSTNGSSAKSAKKNSKASFIATPNRAPENALRASR